MHKDERKLARKRGDHRQFSNQTRKKMKERDTKEGEKRNMVKGKKKKGTWKKIKWKVTFFVWDFAKMKKGIFDHNIPFLE